METMGDQEGGDKSREKTNVSCFVSPRGKQRHAKKMAPL